MIGEADVAMRKGEVTFLLASSWLQIYSMAHLCGVHIGLQLQVCDERRGGRLRGRDAEFVFQHEFLLERRVVRTQLADGGPAGDTCVSISSCCSVSIVGCVARMRFGEMCAGTDVWKVATL